MQILKRRIEREYEDIEEQSGFHAGRSCIDSIFVLEQLIEKRKARNLPTHLIFVDHEKAYDTVPLKPLFETLTKTELNKIYIRCIWKSAPEIGNIITQNMRKIKGCKAYKYLGSIVF